MMLPENANTFFQLHKFGLEQLLSAHIEDASLESELMLLAAFNISKNYFFANLNESINHLALRSAKKLFIKYLSDRITTQKPIQYILGRVNFKEHPYKIARGVLIPRPETEILVDIAYHDIKRRGSLDNLVILELGSGSGVISIELALLLNNAQIFSWDISKRAYLCSIENAQRFNVMNVKFFHQNFFTDPLVLELIKSHDNIYIISNPPYIPSEDILQLQPKVRLFEPKRALDGGCTGLKYYKKLLFFLVGLKKFGFKDKTIRVFWEIGINEDQPLIKFLDRVGISEYCFYPDFSSINRVLTFAMSSFNESALS